LIINVNYVVRFIIDFSCMCTKNLESEERMGKEKVILV